MPSNDIEVLDANIIVLPAAPLTQLSQAPALFQSDELKSLMKTVTGAQVLQLDAASGNVAPMLSFESMRDQRIANIGANRIEVHDRSGSRDFNAESLVRIIQYLVRELEVTVGTLGANFDVTFPVPDGQNAARAIANALFSERKDYMLGAMQSLGGAGRLFLEQPDGVRYTIAIEPRFNSLETTDLFITSNANLATKEMPSGERLLQLVRDNCGVVEHVAHTLFSVSW